MNKVNPLRLLLKALILYAIANVIFAYVQPPVGKLSIYNWIVPGRERMPYEREIEYYSVSHTIPVYEDMDAMFESHIVSRPKPADEYRVMLVGDSSTWAFELTPEENIASQLNLLNLTACDGRRIVFYNIAFPLPYVVKDVLIMEKALEYKPDMFLWLVTLDAFRDRNIYKEYFLTPYAQKTLYLVEKYQLTNLDVEGVSTPDFWGQTIIGQRSRLKKIVLLQLYGLPWSASGLDYYYRDWEPLSPDQSDSLLFDLIGPDELDIDDLLFNVLEAGHDVVGDKLLMVVNEPIFIGSGENSDIRYNDFYPRWAYDTYRDYLGELMKKEEINYLDLWNVLPASEFTDTPFHRTLAGERLLAELISQSLVRVTCSQ